MTTARWLLVGLIAATGCRIDALEGAEYAGPKNRCAVGCPTGSLCVNDACVAEQTSYPLILEATPPPSSSFAPGVTFTKDVEDRRSGNVMFVLPEPARVTARLEAGTSLPLVLRLERQDAVPGVGSAAFEAKTLSNSAVPMTPPISVDPASNYYVFVAPANDADLTTVPPVQLRNDDTREPLVVTFSSGGNELRVAYAGALRKVDITLLDDKGAPLTSADEARDIYVQDLTTGRLASTIAHTCREPGAPLKSEVTLTLAPELAGHRYSLRIETAERPCSAAAPAVRSTLDYDLQALDVEGRGNRVTLTIPRLVTALVTGVVKGYGKNTPISGKIVLRSVKLDQTSDAVTGQLSSTVTTPIAEGTFSAIVIPGTYRADIIPSSDASVDSNKFAICVDCTVPSQDASAKPGTRVAEFRVVSSKVEVLSFEVPQRVGLRASAGGFDGALFTVGTWEALSATSGLLFSAAGSPLLTRSQTGNVAVVVDTRTGARWNVGAALDPGLYDLIVRTHEDSGYPWIVLPQFEVEPRATLDIGLLKASPPVVITGTVTGPDGKDPIPRATVRARAQIVLDSQKTPVGAVLVGETRADDAGNYRLVLPSTLTRPAKASTGPT
jgi:hypothetical protein